MSYTILTTIISEGWTDADQAAMLDVPLPWASGQKGKRGQVCPWLLFSYVLSRSMVRPLRIEYPRAWYHVINRGRE